MKPKVFRANKNTRQDVETPTVFSLWTCVLVSFWVTLKASPSSNDEFVMYCKSHPQRSEELTTAG